MQYAHTNIIIMHFYLFFNILNILTYFEKNKSIGGFNLDIIKIISLSFSSLIILFLLTKLMGNREMSQLTMFDYIVGITIGSIAAEMSHL